MAEKHVAGAPIPLPMAAPQCGCFQKTCGCLGQVGCGCCQPLCSCAPPLSQQYQATVQVIQVPETYQVPITVTEWEDYSEPQEFSYPAVEHYDHVVHKSVQVEVPEEYFEDVTVHVPIEVQVPHTIQVPVTIEEPCEPEIVAVVSPPAPRENLRIVPSPTETVTTIQPPVILSPDSVRVASPDTPLVAPSAAVGTYVVHSSQVPIMIPDGYVSPTGATAVGISTREQPGWTTVRPTPGTTTITTIEPPGLQKPDPAKVILSETKKPASDEEKAPDAPIITTPKPTEDN